jgi:hypothetical protein
MTTGPATLTKGSTMNRTADIENAREVDTRVAAAWELFWAAFDGGQGIEKSIRGYKYLNGDWTNRIDAANSKLEIQNDKIAELRAAARAIDDAEYTGWNRFFLVKHIHSNRHCSSFRWNTRIGWLPQVSGLTEAEALAQYDETLCTKCFKTAPVAK